MSKREIERAILASVDTRDNAGWFHVSMLGLCPRAQVLAYLGERPEYSDYRQIRAFHAGEDFHRRLGEYLTHLEGYELIGCEVEVAKPELQLKGHVDALLWQDFETFVLEAKSVNPYAFRTYQEGIQEAYFYSQIQGYLWLTELHTCLVLIENRADFSFRFLSVERDEETISELRQLVEYLNRCVKEGRLPERNCSRPCEYKRACYNLHV